MAEFITEEDLASYLRVTIKPGAADMTLELANGLVTDVVGDLDPVPTRVKAITLEAAARHYRNPLGFSSEQVKVDDYDTTERREGKALVTPGVYLTPDEETELLGLVGVVRRGRVGTIRVRVPDAT